MVRKKHDSGKDSFELIPEKANKLNDDRALKHRAFYNEYISCKKKIYSD